jgi:hypothetical protein
MPHEEDAAREAREDAALAINNVLLGLPLLDRISALACSLIAHEPRAPFAILTLVEVAKWLTKKLPESEHASTVWHLNAAAAELEASWH